MKQPAASQARESSDERTLRADARRNRQRVLEAARQVFAERGLAVPIDEIAKRAGVGVGTLYRHFPTKEKLFEAIVHERVTQLIEHAEELSLRCDAADALFQFLTDLVGAAIEHRDLADELSRHEVEHQEFKDNLSRSLDGAMSRLLAKAQACGTVRCDVDVNDIQGLMMGMCAAATKVTFADSAHLVRVICDGLRVTRTAGDDKAS